MSTCVFYTRPARCSYASCRYCVAKWRQITTNRALKHKFPTNLVGYLTLSLGLGASGVNAAPLNEVVSPAIHTPVIQISVGTTKRVTLASYMEVSTTTCKALAAPNVAITQHPSVGRAHVQTRTATVPVTGCGTLTLPVVEVIYEAPAQTGRDDVGWATYFQQIHRNNRSRALVTITP